MASYTCLLHHPYGATMGTIRIASSLLQVREREPMPQTTVQTALEPMVCMQRVQMVLSHQRQWLQRRVSSCTQDPHILNSMSWLLQITSFAPLSHCSSSFSAGSKEPLKQTEPPSIPVASLFPSGVFPEGERQSYTEEYAPYSICHPLI